MKSRDPDIIDVLQRAQQRWPADTARQIAICAGVTERGAKYWLANERTPNGRSLVRLQRALGIIDSPSELRAPV